jgi:hypothetical protein
MADSNILRKSCNRPGVAGLAGALMLAGMAAQADTLTPDPLVSGTAALSSAATWATTSGSTTLPANVAGNPNGASGTGLGVNDLTANSAGTYTFTDSYSGTTATYGNVSITPAGGSAEAIGFMDTYIIAVPTSTSNAFAFSTSLQSNSGLSDLSLRLYQYASGTYPSLTSVNPNIVYSGSAGPNLIDAWSTNTVLGSSIPPACRRLRCRPGNMCCRSRASATGPRAACTTVRSPCRRCRCRHPSVLLLSGLGVLGGFALRKRPA